MARRRWIGAGGWQTLSHENLDGVMVANVVNAPAPAGRGPRAFLCTHTGDPDDADDGGARYRMGRAGESLLPGDGLLARASFYFTAYPSTGKAAFMSFLQLGRELRISTDGRLRIARPGAGATDYAPQEIPDDPIPLNTWVTFELAAVPGSAGRSVFAVRRDGDVIFTRFAESIPHITDERVDAGIFAVSFSNVGDPPPGGGSVYVTDCALGDTDAGTDKTWLGPGNVRALRPSSGSYYDGIGSHPESRFAPTTWWHLPIERPVSPLSPECESNPPLEVATVPDPADSLNNAPPDAVGNERGREPLSGGDGWESHSGTQLATPAREFQKFYTGLSSEGDPPEACWLFAWDYSFLTTPPEGEGISLTMQSPADVGIGGTLGYVKPVLLGGNPTINPNTWPSIGKFGFWTERNAKPAASGDVGFFTMDDIGGTGAFGAGEWPQNWHVLDGFIERDVAAFGPLEFNVERLEASSAGLALAGVGINVEGDTSPQPALPRPTQVMCLV